MSIAEEMLLRSLHKKVDELVKRIAELEKRHFMEDHRKDVHQAIEMACGLGEPIDKRTKAYRESIGR